MTLWRHNLSTVPEARLVTNSMSKTPKLIRTRIPLFIKQSVSVFSYFVFLFSSFAYQVRHLVDKERTPVKGHLCLFCVYIYRHEITWQSNKNPIIHLIFC